MSDHGGRQGCQLIWHRSFRFSTAQEEVSDLEILQSSEFHPIVPEAVCNFKQQHRSTYQRKGMSGIICCLAKLHQGPVHTEPHSTPCLAWSCTFYLEASCVPFLPNGEALVSYTFIAFCSSRVFSPGTSLCVLFPTGLRALWGRHGQALCPSTIPCT